MYISYCVDQVTFIESWDILY